MMERWRGAKALVADTIDQGSRAVERLQKETARRPLDLLARIPPLEVPAKGILEIHHLLVSNTHAMIRLVNRVVADTLDVVIDMVDKRNEHASRSASQ
ncbi:hypothetical protein [Polyangium jinanense]|uniref:Uncharacterized protein n=1 Tax=Polyangium jinanense TaxID=2829994 RepID=A0A9X3XHF3_9BACT|nr:hypothetical protein [Polyangium jinanense]MDC3962109.1 hypothetical protein [Polyangium jinanense]MDC3988728.1 hypothetical protein [Polyangium jinanense]